MVGRGQCPPPTSPVEASFGETRSARRSRQHHLPNALVLRRDIELVPRAAVFVVLPAGGKQQVAHVDRGPVDRGIEGRGNGDVPDTAASKSDLAGEAVENQI